MKFYNYINEKINLNIPVKVIKNSKDTWMATFEVDEVLYKFEANFDADFGPDFDEPAWGIVFWNMTISSRFSRGSAKITGTMGGKSLKVFSGVASALKAFIRDKKPNAFFFTAEEPSRIKLYKRFTKIITQKFAYNLSSYEQEGDSFFEFTKS
jgi:hypothetical protein